MKHFASSTRFASLFALVLVTACGAPAAPVGDDGDDDPKFGDTGDDGRPNADGDEGAGDGEGTETNASQGSSSSGDGDAGDGDGDGGDGDTSSGDGDGDTGDGDGSSGDGDGDTGDGDGDTGAPDCFGPTELPTDTVPWEQPADPTAIGSTWPYWEAEDFQPLSCLFGETFSPNAFLGRVTVFVNWRATCSYCQAQASKFEELRVELKLMGHEVYFVGLNQVGYDAPEYQAMLSELVSFNLMQGTSDHDLWALGNNQKDDIFIYDETGHLVDYIYALGETTTNMNTPEGYDNVKNAVLAALGESP